MTTSTALHVPDIAKMLGCSEWRVREYAKAGELKHWRIGDHGRGVICASEADVLALRESLRPIEALPRKRRRRRP
jgi:hypothetical protein